MRHASSAIPDSPARSSAYEEKESTKQTENNETDERELVFRLFRYFLFVSYSLFLHFAMKTLWVPSDTLKVAVAPAEVLPRT
jgi:hypothetical protein